MPLLEKRSFSCTFLELANPVEGQESINHVFEPEYHQAVYVNSCTKAAEIEGAFQLHDPKFLSKYPYRGIQPQYADDDEDSESLQYEGMVMTDGNTMVDDTGSLNVCALKSACVRQGFVDFSLARSVSRSFF
jgi:hypothetical protein